MQNPLLRLRVRLPSLPQCLPLFWHRGLPPRKSPEARLNIYQQSRLTWLDAVPQPEEPVPYT